MPVIITRETIKGYIMDEQNRDGRRQGWRAGLALLIILSFADYLIAACPGDINRDGGVDQLDAGIVETEIGRTNCFTEPCQADLNGDGEVNGKDKEIVQSDLGRMDCLQGNEKLLENAGPSPEGVPGEEESRDEPQPKPGSVSTDQAAGESGEEFEAPGKPDREVSPTDEPSKIKFTRFKDNEDGTITDPDTGLMWTKNANLPADKMLFYNSLNYVREMNRGHIPNFGYTDWRLPTLEELKSLVDYTLYSGRGHGLPTGHPFNNVQLQKYGSYPVGSVYFWQSENAWLFSLYCRVVGRNVGSCLGYVWPVRNCK